MTKLEIINNQHKLIHDAIKNIEDVIINRDKSNFKTHDLISDLILSFKQHFYDEEMLIDSSYHNNNHKKEHYMLISFLEEILQKEHIEVESILFLKNWEKDHYVNYDKFLLESIK